MRMLRVALVQFEARHDVDANIAHAVALAREAAVCSDLVVLPEYLQYRGTPDGWRRSARPVPGPTTDPFAAVAREHGCWILAGTRAEVSGDRLRPYNTAVVIGPSGVIVARYRKVHLFDVAVDDGPHTTESSKVTPGDGLVAVDLAGRASGSRSATTCASRSSTVHLRSPAPRCLRCPPTSARGPAATTG